MFFAVCLRAKKLHLQKKRIMIEIIPAIDIIDGKCVRLSQGDYD